MIEPRWIDDRAVVDAVALHERGADDQRGHQVRARGDDLGDRLLDGGEQCVLEEEVVDGVAGQAELGEDRHRDAVVVAGVGLLDHLGGVGGRVGQVHRHRAGGDAGEALGVGRVEVHALTLGTGAKHRWPDPGAPPVGPSVESVDISPCVTDADYEEWRRVRITVIPYERTQSLAEMREGDSPERLLLLARVDGMVAGSGLSDRAESAGSGSVIPRVLPEFRRQGIGTVLLHRLADHVAALGLPDPPGVGRRRRPPRASRSASASSR